MICYFLDASQDEEFEVFEPNYNNIVTPINIPALRTLLKRTNYNKVKSEEIVNGFMYGFDIGYQGPVNRCQEADNIPITVGSHQGMWDKLLKEVKLHRYAGPFRKPLFKFYVQSPIGLVPKDNGKQTRLIFHLSYNFGQEENQQSINHHTPEEFCSVRYRDLDYAVQTCLNLRPEILRTETGCKEGIEPLFFAKNNLRSAFRILPILPKQRLLLLMKAKNPKTRNLAFFVEKCLPFGSSASCAKFQLFSDCLKHIFEAITGQHFRVTNYLDDFLFVSETQEQCDNMVRGFLNLCEEIGCPVALDKTEWASERMIFLGVMLDGISFCLAIPQEKMTKALNLV